MGRHSKSPSHSSPHAQNREDDPTRKDIMLFKTSLLARRFPHLQQLSDEDILQLIAADHQAEQRRHEDPRMNRSYPKTGYQCPRPKKEEWARSTPSQPVPFWPVSPSQAREEASRRNDERFLSTSTPFDLDRECFNTDRTTDRLKELRPPFLPSCPSEAQDTIKVDYYLYSPKVPEKQAERKEITRRSTANREQLRELFQTRRGHTLV